MSDSQPCTEFFQILSKVLLRCWIFGLILGLVGYAAYMLAGDLIYQFHDRVFGLTKNEVDMIFCCGMGLLKLFVIVFFMIPWLAIRFVVDQPITPA